jgi:hypothetical protein
LPFLGDCLEAEVPPPPGDDLESAANLANKQRLLRAFGADGRKDVGDVRRLALVAHV